MKHIKMVLYGEPGVGKSVFAFNAPKPFFITTDGNYEYLEEFGAKEKDHIQVNSWKEAKKAFSNDYKDYETIVIDLTEDLFKWCEYEYCKINGYEHVSEPGFAKGYDITRNDFFINICKVLNLEKNIILIMHGITSSVKDRRGIEHTKYCPTSRIPDKVLDMIEGRVRYFLRCYLKAEENENGQLIKKRYLSLVPKENEYGILRGIDETTIPTDIPLNFNIFAKTIGLNIAKEDIKENVKENKVEEIIKENKVEETKEDITEKLKSVIKENKIETKQEEIKQEKVLTNSDKDAILEQLRAKIAAKQK